MSRLNDLQEAIAEMPTIEPRCEVCEAFNETRLLIPQPERTGRWISVFDEDEDKCSECQATFFCASTRFNFCPNCGADMTEKSEEPKKCDTCRHVKSQWFNRCADCSDFELWESKE